MVEIFSLGKFDLVDVEPLRGQAKGNSLRSLAAGFVAVKSDAQAFHIGLFAEAYMVGRQAVCPVTGDGVMDAGGNQGKAVDDRFGEDDFFMGFGGLPVEETAAWTRKVEMGWGGPSPLSMSSMRLP